MLELIASAFLGAFLSWLVTLPFQKQVFQAMRTVARLAALEPGKRETTRVNYSEGFLGTSFGEGWPIGLVHEMEVEATATASAAAELSVDSEEDDGDED